MPPHPLPSGVKSNRRLFIIAAVSCLLVAAIIGLIALYYHTAESIQGLGIKNVMLRDAMDGAIHSPQVRAELGRPIRSFNAAEGHVDLPGTTSEGVFIVAPLSGPKASGDFHFQANRTGDTWTVTRNEVVVSGSRKRISIGQ